VRRAATSVAETRRASRRHLSRARIDVTLSLMRICVFCGSSTGRGTGYLEVASGFGRLLAREGIGLVYGGASVGLMGALADGVRAEGGEVIGVIPESIVALEVAHPGLDDLRVVGTMHERKATMAALADAFVALPGGLGTLEELFEVWTWGQLGLHDKPCAVLDSGGFYRQLIGFIDHCVHEGFVSPTQRTRLIVESDPVVLLARIRASQGG
jgi:uncharacterized protein (TIGR00730 family)